MINLIYKILNEKKTQLEEEKNSQGVAYDCSSYGAGFDDGYIEALQDILEQAKARGES